MAKIQDRYSGGICAYWCLPSRPVVGTIVKMLRILHCYICLGRASSRGHLSASPPPFHMISFLLSRGYTLQGLFLRVSIEKASSGQFVEEGVTTSEWHVAHK